MDLTSLSLLADGSLTLAEPTAHQLFHNRSGAWVESHTLYVAHTLPHLQPPAMAGAGQPFRVLEGCFGLGYNTWALLMAWWSGELPQTPRLHVIGCDTDLTLSTLWADCVATAPHPAADTLAWALASAMAGGASRHEGAIHLHLAHPTAHQTAQVTVFECNLATLLASLPKGSFHTAFHDPFSRDIHPELWSQAVFDAYARLLSPGGTVITYSCAGAVRRALAAAGFAVGRTGPVGGKRSGGVVAVRH